MDSRLREAALNGDVAALHQLFEEDPLLLQRLPVTTETPLHIACLLGHVDFAAQILNLCPDIAQTRDERGSYPLHLAAARGKIDILEQILTKKPLQLKVRDNNGRTPLHLAAENGHVHVLDHLLEKDEELAGDTTYRQETALHLSVKGNQIEVAKLLVGRHKKLLSMKDDKGNTVFHLATARKHMQMLKLFLEDNADKEVVNAKNEYNMTALDVLIQSPSEADDLVVGEMLRIAGCTERQFPPPPTPPPPPPKTSSTWSHTLNSLLKSSWEQWKNQDDKFLSEMHNTLMIVATVIASVTFASGLNPPGGFWQDPPDRSSSHEPGKAINNDYQASRFTLFMYFDMMGLVSSLTIILFLISGLPLKNKYMTWILAITMWVSVSSVTMAFVFGTKLIIISHNISAKLFWVLVMWIGLMFLLLACHCFLLIAESASKFSKWIKEIPVIRKIKLGGQ